MKSRIPQAIAVIVAATAASLAGAYDSQKSGDAYVYAPTTLGSRSPQPYVSEPVASMAAGAQAGDAGHVTAIVEALNAEQSLKGSKLTVAPDGEKVLMTGVTVTREQMNRALDIAHSQAGDGNVTNAITSEELVIVTNPVPAGDAMASADTLPTESGSSSAAASEVIQPATPGEPAILPANPRA
jgi:hypothetical protein